LAHSLAEQENCLKERLRRRVNVNKIKDAFSKVKFSDEYKNKLISDLKNGSIEKKRIKIKNNYRSVAAAAAVILVIAGSAGYKLATPNKPQGNVVNKSNTTKTISIPKIELPSGGASAKMVPLIVYNGRVYTMSGTAIESESGKKLLGEKLGTTKGNINEWSKQDEYSKELASTIGIEDVYTVKGYDKTFRIMTNLQNSDGTSYPQFYDCLNGITIKNGTDIFGKLNIQGNIIEAKYRSFSEWNNGIEAANNVKDLELLNKFFGEVNKSSPYLLEEIESALGDYQNEEQYREITLSLKDGSKVSFSILKSGYIHYGLSNTYFKVESKIALELWSQLSIS
jgi:hypothetical protein